MKAMRLAIVALVLAGCGTAVPPEVLHQWQGHALYTCCNLRYEGKDITDANYAAGTILPFGSPVVVDEMSDHEVKFTSGATTLELKHKYGREQESSQQYFHKILVPDDPHERFAKFPPAIQTAIDDGRVERGMTREQVIMSIGYPPTHQTPTLDMSRWTYWSGRMSTYTVIFDDRGVVTRIVGGVPTSGDDVE